DVVEPEEVLDDVDGESDVGAVLRARRREQLGEVDGAVDELALVAGVDGHRPVGVGAAHHDRAERRCVVEDRADIHTRIRDALLDRLGGVPGVVVLEPAAPVELVVTRDDDVVEVDVDRHAGCFGWCLGHEPSSMRGYSSRCRRSSTTTAMSANTTTTTPLSTHVVSTIACGMNDTNAPAAAASC